MTDLHDRRSLMVQFQLMHDGRYIVPASWDNHTPAACSDSRDSQAPVSRYSPQISFLRRSKSNLISSSPLLSQFVRHGLRERPARRVGRPVTTFALKNRGLVTVENANAQFVTSSHLVRSLVWASVAPCQGKQEAT